MKKAGNLQGIGICIHKRTIVQMARKENWPENTGKE
jgi:hypothetical protein